MRTSQELQQTNAEIARLLWNATADGDGGALLEFLAPNVEWHSHGQNPIAKHVYGPAALLDYFALSADLVDDMTSDLLEIYSSERGAVIRYRTRARRGPKSLDGEVLLSLTIDNRLVTRADIVPVEQDMHDAFWMLE